VYVFHVKKVLNIINVKTRLYVLVTIKTNEVIMH